MDRSFLSQPKVVAALREFVCVRLATYENGTEARFLQEICPTGSGQLENTAFTILTPDGKKQLVRGSRSARDTFDDADHMAETMNRIAGWYPRQKAQSTLVPDVPTVASVRLAIDVAACDNQPLVLFQRGPSTQGNGLVDKLKVLAWTEEFRGRFIYAEFGDASELSSVEGTEANVGLFVIQPDRFGQKATVLAGVTADASAAAVADGLRKGLALYRPALETFKDHIRAGHQHGAFWQTAIPVTDPMEQKARERGRSRQGPLSSGP
jgi:hypothetical protein